MPDQIKCPHCQKAITISQALADELKKDLETRHQAQLKALKTKLVSDKNKFDELQKSLKQKTQQLLKEQELKLKKELWQKAQEKASEKLSLELKDSKAKEEETEKLNEKLKNQILEERKNARKIKQDAENAKLELDKQMELEKEKIKNEVQKLADEDNRNRILEKDKKISDLTKLLEEAKRKASQGSQQNQGEVLELDLEKTLKESFLHDLVEPVAKGVAGADIIQTVRNNGAKNCGTILYEIKQTKRFNEAWIVKLKDDLRKVKANIPVLVSTVLPESVDGFGQFQGIWLTKPRYVLPLIILLRKNLIQVAYERSASEGKGKKSELLFSYVSSHEFRQRVEALVEVYTDMQTQINKERIAYEKSWSQRAKQVQRLLENTAGIYGDMQGLVGSSMQEIKGLEIGESNDLLESGQDQKLF